MLQTRTLLQYLLGDRDPSCDYDVCVFYSFDDDACVGGRAGVFGVGVFEGW